jgi:hypothetical protein
MYWLKDCLETGPDQPDDNKIWHWNDVLTAMRAELDQGTVHSADVARNHGGDRQHRTSIKTPSSPMQQHDRKAIVGDRQPLNYSEEADADVPWEMLINHLGVVTSTGFTHPFSKRTARQWASRVARYLNRSTRPPAHR